VRIPNWGAGRGARRWNATPEAGSASVVEMDRGVEAECCSRVEKPPNDLCFVPMPLQGAAGIDET